MGPRRRMNAACPCTIPAPLWMSNPAGPMSLAVARSAVLIWSCVAAGLNCFSSATSPARIGVAAEVPESLGKYPAKWLIEQKSGLFGSRAAGPWLL